LYSIKFHIAKSFLTFFKEKGNSTLIYNFSDKRDAKKITLIEIKFNFEITEPNKIFSVLILLQ